VFHYFGQKTLAACRGANRQSSKEHSGHFMSPVVSIHMLRVGKISYNMNANTVANFCCYIPESRTMRVKCWHLADKCSSNARLPRFGDSKLELGFN
jgi:hypothetical protein